MAFFKEHRITGEQGEPARDVQTRVNDECAGPIKKMESVMSTRGADVAALNEATETLKVINRVITEGPEALPKDAVQSQEAKQQTTPGTKEQLQAAKQQSQEQTANKEERVEENRFGMSSKG